MREAFGRCTRGQTTDDRYKEADQQESHCMLVEQSGNDISTDQSLPKTLPMKLLTLRCNALVIVGIEWKLL